MLDANRKSSKYQFEVYVKSTVEVFEESRVS